MNLILTPEQAAQIEQEGVDAYPNECCGAMLGNDLAEGPQVRRIVHRLEKLTNSFAADEQYHRFSLDPREQMQLEKPRGRGGAGRAGFLSQPSGPSGPAQRNRPAECLAVL